jgi:hypothetical protein
MAMILKIRVSSIGPASLKRMKNKRLRGLSGKNVMAPGIPRENERSQIQEAFFTNPRDIDSFKRPRSDSIHQRRFYGCSPMSIADIHGHMSFRASEPYLLNKRLEH